MKKILLICLSLVLVTAVNAQTRWGVKAGANMSKLTGDIEGEKLGWGFHGGLMLEHAFGTSGFAIQPELLYMQANSSTEVTSLEDIRTADASITFNQLQLPINLKYSFGLEHLKLFALAGPYLSYALSGDIEGVDLFDKIGDEDAAMKRFDLGVGIGIGVEISRFSLTISDQFGMLNTSNYDDTNIKSNNVMFSLGFFF